MELKQDGAEERQNGCSIRDNGIEDDMVIMDVSNMDVPVIKSSIVSARNNNPHVTTAPTAGASSASKRHARPRGVERRISLRAGASLRHCHEESREERQREAGGVIHVPGRILATLQRKFWDSNKARYDL